MPTVLVRYLAQNDVKQSASAARFIEPSSTNVRQV